MKLHRVKATRTVNVWDVRKWWNERIIEGCQFEFFEDTRQNVDWRGEEKWKRFVRIAALKADFERSRDTQVMFFAALFKRAAQHDDIVVKRVPIDISHNLTMLKPKLFYRFVKQPLTPLPV